MAPQEAAFREMYTNHSPAVLRYALRRAATREEAADVVAETFLVAWRKFDAVPAGDDRQYWLYAVARKTLANLHRKTANQQRLGEALKHHLAEQPDEADISIEVLQTREVLATLDPEERELIGLSVWEGLNSSEISQVLGIPASTVRTQLSRSRHKLKAGLNDFSIV